MLYISSKMSTPRQLPLLNEGGLDLHTGQSSAYSSKPSDGQWMEENQIFEEEQEASATTLSEDKDVNVKVLRSKNSNGNKRVYDCPVCHKQFGAPSKLKRHCLIHTNQRPFQCSICWRAFRERSHLKVHVRTHTNPVKQRTPSFQSYKDNKVSCSQTSKSRLKPFPKNRTAQNDTSSTDKQKTAATDLIETNSGTVGVKIAKGHWCPLCLKCFKAPSKLKRHILIHTGERPFKCSVCPKAFREKSHLKVHKCKEEFRLECNSILSDRQVKENKIKQNAEEGVVSPDVVTLAGKRIFPVSKSSDRMCMLQLKKKSGYQCEICLKKFSFPSKLTQHLFVHFDVKPYTCTICRKSFKQAYYLHKHLKVHTGKGNNKSRLNRVPQKHKVKPPTPGALEGTNNCRPVGGNVCLPQILDSLETKKHKKLECRSQLNQNVPLTESNSSTIEIKSSDTLNNTEMQITTSSPIYLKHKQKGVNQCSICLNNFPYPSKLTRHILSHTDSRPFKCQVCLKSFRYRGHLQLHVRIHKKKGWNIIAGHLEPDHTVSFSNAEKSKDQDVQISSQDGAEDSATAYQGQNMVIESQKMSGDSIVYLQVSLLNEGLDLHTGQSSEYFSKLSEGQWMEENQETEEEQEASVTTQSEDKDVNVKVLQRKNSNGNKRVYDCPVCHKRFGAPSKLKRHCLIHTDQRPFQCSICCSAFRERSHLKVHIRTHTNPVKQRTPSLQSYRDNSVSCNRAFKSGLNPSPKQPTAQDDTKSTDKEKSTVHQDQNMVTENMASQKISGHCSVPDVYLQDSLLNEGGLDLHTGQSSAYSSKPSESQWMEEDQENEEEQEASVTTQIEDKNVNVKVLQSKNSNGNKRVHDCPVCHKRFGAPSKLKRHCLIHTNQRPFQCSICCNAFRERSHLKVHIRTHTNPVKQRTPSLQSYRDNRVSCNRASKSRIKAFPKHLTAQNNASSTEKQQSTVHHDENMVTENMVSPKNSADWSDSDVYLQDSLLNEGGLDLHTGQSSAYSSKPSEGQWMEENQETEEEQEASVTTQNKDKDVNAKVLQRKNSNGNKRVYDCTVCHKQFGAPSKLKRHCLIHTNQRPFECSICCRAFRERSHLKVHIRTHNVPVKQRTPSLQSYRDNSVSCNRASKSGLNPSPKKTPAQHDTKSTDKEKSTVHQYQYKVTENMASQKMSGHCSDSDVYLQDSLLNEGGLDLHTRQSSAYSSKHSEGQCMEKNQENEEEQEASATTLSEDKDVNVKVLRSKNSNGNKRVYDCLVCHKQFGAPSKLKRHCLIHTDQRPFQCSICWRAFRERSHLKVHVRTHTNLVKQRTPSFQSYKDNKVSCSQTSKSRLKLFPKKRTAQNDTSSTDKQKTAATDLIETNSGTVGVKIAKGHWCPLCLKCFKAPSKLKRHILIHTGERPFKCSVCPKAFREKSHLKVHKCKEEFRLECNSILSDRQVKENKIKQNAEEGVVSPDVVTLAGKRIFPVSKSSDRMCMLQLKKKSGYQCEICLKKFSFPSKLTRHLFVHFDVKPYTCTICRKSFKQAYYLHKHLKVHTGKGNNKSRLSRVPQKHKAKPPTPGALEGTNNCRPVGGNVCLPQILDSLETKKHKKLECRSQLNQNVPLTESNSSTIEIKSSDTLNNTEMQITTSSPIYLKHKQKGVNQCSICLKNFPYPSKLTRHILSHTDSRPFKCQVCLKSFRYRGHLQLHVRIHKKKGWNIIAGHLEPDHTVSFSNAEKSKDQDVQISSQDGAEDSATAYQGQNMVIESQKMSGDSIVYLQVSLLNEGLDLHTGQSSEYFSKLSEGQWMEENQETEEEQEASVTTQSEDKDVNVKVLQRKNSNGNKRVYDCPVCLKRFGAPSKLKRHCLIHTDQRPFQCSICCHAFRERSHLKVHIRTHTNPVQQIIPSLQSYRDNRVSCNQASKSRLNPFPKHLTAQNNASSTEKQQSIVHHDENMVTEDMASQKMSGDCSDSDVYLQDSLLNEGLDLHTGQSSAYSSKPSKGQWMEENQETEKEQEASDPTQSEDNDVNVKVLQSKNSNGNKRVHDCPVCQKRFGAPSKLKRHCLIHTNQRPFQCSICCRAFRERSHLKVHIKTHNVPVKQRTPSLQSYRDNSVPCNRASKSGLKPSPKQPTAQNDTSSTDKQMSTVHKDQNMVTDYMPSQKMSGDCNDSDLYFSKSTSPLEKSEVVFRCNNKSIWGMTDKTDILLDGKKASDIVPFGRVSDCPPKTDSSLHHCASESRIEEKWAHHMDDIKDCVFVDSDTVKCVPDSYEPSSCQYQQKPDVPGLREIVVVGLLDFQDPGECFTKPPHDLPICPDCSQCFPTIRSLYAHECANRYSEGKIKKSHQCDICLKFFNAPSKLKRHCVTHTGQRPFQCTQCQKSFTQSHHLKTHMLSHR